MSNDVYKLLDDLVTFYCTSVASVRDLICQTDSCRVTDCRLSYECQSDLRRLTHESRFSASFTAPQKPARVSGQSASQYIVPSISSIRGFVYGVYSYALSTHKATPSLRRSANCVFGPMTLTVRVQSCCCCCCCGFCCYCVQRTTSTNSVRRNCGPCRRRRRRRRVFV